MEPSAFEFRHGTVGLANGATRFRVWAPGASKAVLRLTHPERFVIDMQRRESGYWEVQLESAPPGSRYVYRIDGGAERPDPASRFQPEGVHAPSEVVDAAFDCQDGAWCGLPIEQCVLYELHTGTFTREGRWLKLLDSPEAKWLGTGAALAGQIDSAGETDLDLQPRTAVLYRRCVEA